jgi:hypothetical protein
VRPQRRQSAFAYECDALPNALRWLADTNAWQILTLLGQAVSRSDGAHGARESNVEVRAEPVKRPFDPGSTGTGSIVPQGTPMSGVVGRWAELCFPAGEKSSEIELKELIEEAENDALDDNDEAAAVTWAGGYEFPDRYVDSDVRLLEASALDFGVMVRRRQRQLAHNRLSVERVSRLRPDNPEMDLMIDLAGGMRVHLPEGFTPNGSLPRTPLRDNYVAVSTAVNKMLAALIEEKLAFLLPMEMAQRHVKRLHFCKAHWTTKKGKPSGRP